MRVGELKKGDKVFLHYDARPLLPSPKVYPAEVVKLTPTGWARIESIEKREGGNSPLYSELFYPYEGGHARGWNTLWWRWNP